MSIGCEAMRVDAVQEQLKLFASEVRDEGDLCPIHRVFPQATRMTEPLDRNVVMEPEVELWPGITLIGAFPFRPAKLDRHGRVELQGHSIGA